MKEEMKKGVEALCETTQNKIHRLLFEEWLWNVRNGRKKKAEEIEKLLDLFSTGAGRNKFPCPPTLSGGNGNLQGRKEGKMKSIIEGAKLCANCQIDCLGQPEHGWSGFPVVEFCDEFTALHKNWREYVNSPEFEEHLNLVRVFQRRIRRGKEKPGSAGN